MTSDGAATDVGGTAQGGGRIAGGAAVPAGGRRRGRASGWLVPTLDALIEGAWIAVADAVFAAVSGSAPLGPIPFAIVAGASLFWIRNAADRTTSFVGLAVLYIGAFVGGGLLGGALAAGADEGPRLVFAQGAAVFSALAVFRGSRHADPADDDLVVGSLLQWGFPLLALPWLYASQLPLAERDAFTAVAFPATVVFAAAGLLALGLARLDSLAALSGLNWRSNRAWLVLLFGVLLLMLTIAVPSAFLLGTPLTALIAGLFGPLSVVLTPFAVLFTKIIEAIFFLLTPLIDLIQSLLQQRDQTQDPSPGGAGPFVPPVVDQGEPSTLGLIVLAGIVIAVGIVVFLIILRLTYRPRAELAAAAEGPLEEREFRLPALGLHLPHIRLPHRRIRPSTAAGAYLAFLADLESQPDLARHLDEPPASHAARLRSAGFGDPRAALLAADYELEHYALRPVSPKETSRALRRQVRLHDLIRQRPRPAAAPDTDV